MSDNESAKTALNQLTDAQIFNESALPLGPSANHAPPNKVLENDADTCPRSLAAVSPQTETQQRQDQTNLLPTKQVLIVFIGLSVAMFCE